MKTSFQACQVCLLIFNQRAEVRTCPASICFSLQRGDGMALNEDIFLCTVTIMYSMGIPLVSHVVCKMANLKKKKGKEKVNLNPQRTPQR